MEGLEDSLDLLKLEFEFSCCSSSSSEGDLVIVEPFAALEDGDLDRLDVDSCELSSVSNCLNDCRSEESVR